MKISVAFAWFIAIFHPSLEVSRIVFCYITLWYTVSMPYVMFHTNIDKFVFSLLFILS